MNKYLLEEIEEHLPNVVGYDETEKNLIADFLEALAEEMDNEGLMDFSQLVRRS